MKRRIISLALLSIVALFLASPVWADTLLYDGGPINGTDNAYYIFDGYAVSNQFTIASASNLTYAVLGLWAVSEPSQVDWSIGTTPFGSEVSSGTGSLMNTFKFTNGYALNIFESLLFISGTVAPGAYWLTLGNAPYPNNQFVWWDRNDFGGDARSNQNPGVTIPSEAFQIYGNRGVPEPATILLLGTALIGMVGIRRKVKK